MKALRSHAPKDVSLEAVSEARCSPDEAELRIRNRTTRGTDVRIFYNGHQNLNPPRITGDTEEP